MEKIERAHGFEISDRDGDFVRNAADTSWGTSVGGRA
jgi:hypothetical protein